MHKIAFFLLSLLINGCSLNRPNMVDEVDKVTIVKQSYYVKHHRAYFTRAQLKVIKNGKKYLYFYNQKNNYLAILFHRHNQYVLYNLSQPEQHELTININAKTKYMHVAKTLKSKGFTPLSSLASVGYTVTVAPRVYKGVKTLLVDTLDYSQLQNLYKTAIRTFNADKIKNIQTTLPKPLIYPYYLQYEAQAKTQKQLIQIGIIGQKLKLRAKPTPLVLDVAQPDAEHHEEVLISDTSEKPYAYYAKEADLNELSSYIAEQSTKNGLSYNQYSILKKRKEFLIEEKLFNEGSLEDLIAAYKINKKPKYKKRIMSIMKDVQTNQ